MANTLIPIQTVTVGAGGASTITFTNIPQNYTDLCIKYSVRFSNASIYANTVLRFNNSTSTYSMRRLYGDGSTVSTYSNTDIFDVAPGADATASVFNNAEFYITNYSSSNFKSVSGDAAMETNATTAQLLLTAGLWSTTSPITTISLGNTGYNLAQHSTATLYGVSNGVKATGGTLTVAGGYAYHTFTATGSFLPNQRIKGAEVLVVAGGGGGCGYGAGGAGGLSYKSSSTFEVGSYTAIVGSGGASGISAGGAVGGSGTNSIFAGITSNGGGGGRTNNTGLSGGSGAGGSYNNNAAGSATQGNTGGAIGYGNAGGAGYTNNSTIFNAGGGGGAGTAGIAGTVTPNDGGDGLQTWASWAYATGTGESGYYAGGGGGCSRQTNNMGRGGRGGGGAGGNRNTSAVAGAAVANTGGGGGAGDDDTGGAGASGIIIVRYPVS
jgi:hypothetical protein